MNLVKEIEDIVKFELNENELYILTSKTISKLDIGTFYVKWKRETNGYDFIIIQNKLYITSLNIPQTTIVINKLTGEIIESNLKLIFHLPISKKFRNENHLLIESANSKSIFLVSKRDGSMKMLMNLINKKISISTNDSTFLSIDKRKFTLVDSNSKKDVWQLNIGDIIGEGEKFYIGNNFVVNDEFIAQVVETNSFQSYVISVDYKSGNINWKITGNLTPQANRSKTYLISEKGKLTEIDSKTGKTINTEDYSSIVDRTINSCDGEFYISEETLILKNSLSPNFLLIDRKKDSYMVSKDDSNMKFSKDEPPIKLGKYILANYRVPNNHLKVYEIE